MHYAGGILSNDSETSGLQEHIVTKTDLFWTEVDDVTYLMWKQTSYSGNSRNNDGCVASDHLTTGTSFTQLLENNESPNVPIINSFVQSLHKQTTGQSPTSDSGPC